MYYIIISMGPYKITKVMTAQMISYITSLELLFINNNT